MNRTPRFVIVKLDDPVGPDDAQNFARHIIEAREFADVEWARPAVDDGFGRMVMVGEKVSS